MCEREYHGYQVHCGPPACTSGDGQNGLRPSLLLACILTCNKQGKMTKLQLMTSNPPKRRKKKEVKKMVTTRVELATLALLAPRSNRLS